MSTPDLTNFRYFTNFLNGDARLKNAPQWSFSIIGRTEAVSVLHKEVLDQLQKCYVAYKEYLQQGYGSYREFMILTAKYEAFLNSIYSLCENLSYVVHKLYPSKNLPHFFHEQKNRFLKDGTIDSDYSATLKNTYWYDEVQCMRANSTHFLYGLIALYGETQLGFVNIPLSERKSTTNRILKDGKISIDNIEKHVKQLFNDFLTFLSLFGNHFVGIINQESIQTYACMAPDGKIIGVRSISLKSIQNHEKWTCGNKNCPSRSSCDTIKIE